MGRHTVKGLRQHPNLVLPLHPCFPIQVAARDSGGGFDQTHQWSRNTPCDDQRGAYGKKDSTQGDAHVDAQSGDYCAKCFRHILFYQQRHLELRQPAIGSDDPPSSIIVVNTRTIDVILYRGVNPHRMYIKLFLARETHSRRGKARLDKQVIVQVNQIGLARLAQPGPLAQNFADPFRTGTARHDTQRLPIAADNWDGSYHRSPVLLLGPAAG